MVNAGGGKYRLPLPSFPHTHTLPWNPGPPFLVRLIAEEIMRSSGSMRDDELQHKFRLEALGFPTVIDTTCSSTNGAVTDISTCQR